MAEPDAGKLHSDTWNRARKWGLISVGLGMLAVITALAIEYYKLSRRVDQNLSAGRFEHTFNYFAAAETLSLGEYITTTEFAGAVKRAGFNSTVHGNSVVVQSPAPVELQFANGQISSITDLTNHRRVAEYQLPPQLVTNMSEEGRSKRILVHYSELQPVLIQAIVSVEDKRFFKHDGFDLPRLAKAMYVDFKERGKKQGASTITMQLARDLWLDRGKRWNRKLAEALITVHLEGKLTKQQIFEDYCNTVYLGGRGAFSIDGVGEAARTYFNKDVSKLNLTEAATLAGLIQRPSHFDPFRYPGRALERRNLVLNLMRRNKYITEPQYEGAIAAPLGLRLGASDTDESQYFFDLASEDASRKAGELQSVGAANIYTTIDLRLQQAAERAVAHGMLLVDKELAARRGRKQAGGAGPQIALIALDPHTGEVKALSGGRDYASSQFNRALAKRPPGSAFKPFVYTAALNTAITGGNVILTPASTVDDSPAAFQYDRITYTPNNFKGQYWGTVTLRQALAHSLNVATVKVGEMVGFDRVVALAHAAGLNENIRPTPAVALGAYQVTPLEIARGYTIFANDGLRVEPSFVTSIHDPGGAELYHSHAETRRVLDPRVAFLMVDMLQEVMRSGTAAGVRSRGFTLPAAGKTGTSHDGWFVGFTSQLLCVAWVGFDDYTELGLEGARSALPVWTEFMIEAARYAPYRNAKPFAPPPGVVRATVDLETGHSVEPDCPVNVASSYFIDGTQPPAEQCDPLEVEIAPADNGGVIERRVRSSRVIDNVPQN